MHLLRQHRHDVRPAPAARSRRCSRRSRRHCGQQLGAVSLQVEQALRCAGVALVGNVVGAACKGVDGPHRRTQGRLDLQAYRAELLAAVAPAAPAATPAAGGWRWPHIMPVLAQQVQVWQLPQEPLLHLLDAFEQDVRRTASGQWYADLPELLGYCSRSANPVGRLLLHLYGVRDERSLQQSDAICSALQPVSYTHLTLPTN